jgi:medium-chain acyl-[acyl-carrier-protein] hydrolase
MQINRNSNNPWVARWRPNHAATMRLFCFPYAGGAASLYRTWGNSLPSHVEVCAIQLPGRGARMAEAPLTSLPDILRELSLAIRPYLDLPFAFFGHSMGAMLSLELARLLRRELGVNPVHLFVSGCRALQLRDPNRPTYNLPEPEFIEELRRLGGTPAEVLEHPELLGLILPLLRADFEVCQTYKYTPGRPLPCPITAFGGTQDKTGRAEMEAWREQTTAAFTLRMFPGDHFFLHGVEAKILELIAHALAPEQRKLIRDNPREFALAAPNS